MTNLVNLSADQIVRYGPETICAWLLARNEQRRAGLAAACRSLRAESLARQRAIQNIAAARPSA